MQKKIVQTALIVGRFRTILKLTPKSIHTTVLNYTVDQRHRKRVGNFPPGLKVPKFQNELMKSSFLPKYELNIVRISALYCVIQG